MALYQSLELNCSQDIYHILSKSLQQQRLSSLETEIQRKLQKYDASQEYFVFPSAPTLSSEGSNKDLLTANECWTETAVPKSLKEVVTNMRLHWMDSFHFLLDSLLQATHAHDRSFYTLGDDLFPSALFDFSIGSNDHFCLLSRVNKDLFNLLKSYGANPVMLHPNYGTASFPLSFQSLKEGLTVYCSGRLNVLRAATALEEVLHQPPYRTSKLLLSLPTLYASHYFENSTPQRLKWQNMTIHQKGNEAGEKKVKFRYKINGVISLHAIHCIAEMVRLAYILHELGQSLRPLPVAQKDVVLLQTVHLMATAKEESVPVKRQLKNPFSVVRSATRPLANRLSLPPTVAVKPFTFDGDYMETKADVIEHSLSLAYAEVLVSKAPPADQQEISGARFMSSLLWSEDQSKDAISWINLPQASVLSGPPRSQWRTELQADLQ